MSIIASECNCNTVRTQVHWPLPFLYVSPALCIHDTNACTWSYVAESHLSYWIWTPQVSSLHYPLTKSVCSFMSKQDWPTSKRQNQLAKQNRVPGIGQHIVTHVAQCYINIVMNPIHCLFISQCDTSRFLPTCDLRPRITPGHEVNSDLNITIWTRG